ncbi:MAG: hypothetical protein LJF15_09215 [Acidobacteria bacterium]|nr:hypothetical protein [Acidobacteriota bacterium]
MAIARASCLYCGAELPPDRVPNPPSSADPLSPGGPLTPAVAPEEASPFPRVLIVVDLESARAETLGEALGVAAYEAELLARRGGFHLHRILGGELAEDEASRLRAEGLTVEMLPESEVRTRPLRAVGGDRGEGRLDLRTEEGPLTLRREELILIVRGPIARQYQPTYRRRRVDVASLDEGYRVHFHRQSHPRPVEIDAANFEFGVSVTGSTRLELDAWVDAIGAGVPCDDGFRRLPPAFGVAAPEPKGPLAAAATLSRTVRGREALGEGESVVLDNAAQFVFYSVWRAALERRRGAGGWTDATDPLEA